MKLKRSAQYLLLPTLVLLSACSNSGGGGGSPANNNNQKPELNDYSTCSGATPANLSLYNTWVYKTQGDDGVEIISKFTFESSRLNLTAECSKKKSENGNASVETAVAKASSMISVNDNQVEIWSNDSGRSYGSDVKCEVELSRGKFNYSFQGSCLKMTVEGQKDILMALASSVTQPLPQPTPVEPSNPGNGANGSDLNLPKTPLKITQPLEQFQMNELIVKNQKPPAVSRQFGFYLQNPTSFKVALEDIQVNSCSSNGENKITYAVEGGGRTVSLKLDEQAVLKPGNYNLVVRYLNGKSCSDINIKVATLTSKAEDLAGQDQIDFEKLVVKTVNTFEDPKNASLTYKMTGPNGNVLKTKSFKCDMPYGLKLSAQYPKIGFSIDDITCAGVEPDIQNLVSLLSLISRDLQFSSRKTNAGAKIQFGLDLSNYSFSLNELYQSIQSLNSFVTEESAYFYLAALPRYGDYGPEWSASVSRTGLGQKRLLVKLSLQKKGYYVEEISFEKNFN